MKILRIVSLGASFIGYYIKKCNSFFLSSLYDLLFANNILSVKECVIHRQLISSSSFVVFRLFYHYHYLILEN